MKKKVAKNIVQINVFTNDIFLCKFENEGKVNYMPELKIVVSFPEIVYTNKDGNTIKKNPHTEIFYMTPFRDYRFQISRSISGEGDYASTEVIGFYNLISTLMAGKDIVKLVPTNVSYDDRYIGTHSNIICQLIDSMIRACFQKFITQSPIFDKYDGINVNFGDRETIYYKRNGFAMLDNFGKFAEIVTTYLVLNWCPKISPDETLEYIYSNELEVYDTNGVLLQKGINAKVHDIVMDKLEMLYTK